MRTTARYLYERDVAEYRRAWRLAEVGVDLSGDPLEWVADVASEAARQMPKKERQTVGYDVRLANPFMSQRRLREATNRAVIWRTADINVPYYLTAEQRNLARHGLEDPLDSVIFGVIPLPSEAALCMSTLTTAEANLARSTLLEEANPAIAEMGLLRAVTWRVTVARLAYDMAHPEVPLTQDQLESWLWAHIEDMQSGDGTAGSDPLPFPD